MASTGWDAPGCWAATITTLVVIWWIFEPIPIPVTSMIPLAAMPLTGVLTQKQVAAAYGNQLILLMLGGFILSTAMEKSGAHRRLALFMVNLFGGKSSRRLVFGFMAASAVLSMWISNTATALMLLPVALAVLAQAKDPKLATPLLLGVAYAASIGGMGTPIGSPPNVVFMEIYATNTGAPVSFLTWMSWGLPVIAVLLPIAAIWLTRSLDYEGELALPQVGSWTTEERRVMMVFALTAVAWVTRSEPFGGWRTWLGMPGATDAAVALSAVVLMFLIPDGKGKGGRLLDWESAVKIPWGMLLLFGGGITIASAFLSSGLSTAIGDALSGLSAVPIVVLMFIICLTVTFLTEVTSNTATATLLMPILAAGAIGAGLEPGLFMIPAAMSASCAFMLPVATPPNTVVFGSGRFDVATMAKEGFALNLAGVAIISVVIYMLVG